VENLHTKHADEPGPNGELWNSIGHHSFYAVFQRTRQAAAPVSTMPGSEDSTPKLPADAREDDASYVEGRDGIPALAVMQPGQHFEQVWHVRNTGNHHWREGYRVMCVGGASLDAPMAVPTLPCAPDHEIAIIVPFVAPTAAGAHYSVWRIFNDRGEPFGERLWLLINVAASDHMRPSTPRNARPVAPQPAPDQAALTQPTRRLPEATPTAGAMRDPELYAAWKHHIEQGFANNQMMFQQLLDGFLNPYWTTVWMYRILFGLGVASFLVAAGLSIFTGKEGYTLIFGGISALSLLAYFFNRPLQALEENLQFITWLGLIYNSYWTRLVYLNALPDVQQGLQDATDDAIQHIKELMAAHAKRSAARPMLREE
jgi:hypothetical protein